MIRRFAGKSNLLFPSEICIFDWLCSVLTTQKVNVIQRLFFHLTLPTARPHACCVLFYLLACCLLSACQKTEPKPQPIPPLQSPGIFEKLQSEDVLELQLRTDFSQLLDNGEQELLQPAQLRILNGPAAGAQFSLQISQRGETRKRYCDFPPLKLKFDKDSLQASGLSPIASMKLVTHCKADSLFEHLVIREYLAYLMYQQLTAFSFRVQLARIEYIDSSTALDSIQRFAFLIEPSKQMAQRLNCRKLKEEEVSKRIQKDQYHLLTLFQYMIGNTDWNIGRRHNIKLYQCAQLSAPLPIPYDFDYSGLVNAPYARPHPKLALENVRQRLFQWRGKDPSSLDKSLEIFIANKEKLLQLSYSCPFLSPESQADMQQYLHSFFEIIESEEKRKTALFE